MWVETTEPKTSENVKIQVDTTNMFEPTVSSNAIQDKLTDELLNKIKKEYKDFILFRKDEKPYNMTVTYTAEITLVPRGLQKVFINHYKYEVDGVEFTHEQVKEAIQKSYPEYFI
jgi:hypothetical protein